MFQHTAARRRLPMKVSNGAAVGASFNTQPRGGGCAMLLATLNTPDKFQHTAARRRLLSADRINGENHAVSTHSRAEAAALVSLRVLVI